MQAPGAHTFADSLHCAYLATIFHGVEGEVDLWDGTLLADCTDRIIDLGKIGVAIRHTGLVLSIHDRERGHKSKALVVGL